MCTKKDNNPIKYARKCDECGKGMNEGFCINGGCEYYCTEECLHKHYTKEEYDEMYNDDEGDTYWTEWEDKSDFQFVEVDGELIDIDDLD